MNHTTRAGAIKSWTCVVLLTFILPLGAAELGHVLLTASAAASDRLQAHVAGDDRRTEVRKTACPELTSSVSLN